MSINLNNDSKIQNLKTDEISNAINGFLEKIYRLLGDDIFISYSRIDGLAYAKNLARSLQKKYRFACYGDFFWTATGDKLPPFIVKKLERSKVLIVVISEGAVKWSKNIKEEIEIFKLKEQPIIVIDLNDSYQKHEWSELNGICAIKDLYISKDSTHNKNRPSSEVLKSIKDSFKYRTQYSLQKISVIFSLVLLLLSIFIITGTIALSTIIIPKALAARDTALAQKEQANRELEQFQQSLNEIQGKLKTATNDLAKATSDVKQISGEKEQVEKDRDTAQKQTQRAEAGAIKANKERRRAEKLSLQSKNNAIVAQKEAVESRKNAKQFEIRKLGNQASFFASQPERRIEALEVATEAVRQGFQMTPSFYDLPEEVKKGLTDSVLAMDFAKPLRTKGHLIFTRISPDGKLVFGNINDPDPNSTTPKMFKFFSDEDTLQAIWGTAPSTEYIELERRKSDNHNMGNTVRDAAFSNDGNWLIILSNKIEFWKISKIKSRHQFTKIKNLEIINNTLFLPEEIEDIRLKVNSDGSKLAVVIKERIIRKSRVITFTRNNSNWQTETFLPTTEVDFDNLSAAFNPQNELIIIYSKEAGRTTANSTEIRKTIFHDTQKNLLRILDNVVLTNYYLEDVTNSNDLLMRRKNTLSIDPETNPEFILVNSQNGKILHEFFNKPDVGYIENLKYVKNKPVITFRCSEQEVCISESRLLENAYIFDVQTRKKNGILRT